MNQPAALERLDPTAPDDVGPGRDAPMAERQKWFNERYKDWIAQENADFEKYGNWNEEFRPW